MNISQKEIKNITKMINLNFKIINQRLEKYNKRMDKIIKQTNYPTGITYDQLSENIVQISGNDYKRDILIERLE